MPERSITSTSTSAHSRIAATRRMPSVMNTRSSSRKADGGMTRQIGPRVSVTAAPSEPPEPPLDNGPEDPGAVPPGDLLPVLVRARTIRDRHLGDPVSATQQLAD